MYKQEIENKNESRECDICHRSILYYMEQFHVRLCLPDKKVILGNDLFTSYICLNCLTKEIKKVFIKDLENVKKMETYKG